KHLRIKLTFFQKNSDQIRIMGSIPQAAKVAAGATLILNVGHVVRAFTFDKSGRAVGSVGLSGLLNDSCRINSSRGGAAFSAKFSRGSFSAPLSSEPDPAFQLTNIQGTSKTRTVNVTAYLGTVSYKAAVTGKYIANRGQFTK